MIEVTNAFTPYLQVELSNVKDLSKLHGIEGVPTLKVLEEAYSTKFASRVWLKAQLVVVNDFVGTKEKLDDMQLHNLCDQILVEYAGLNLMELCCFFSRLRSGKYGKFYGSVDPMSIMTALQEFVKDWREDLYQDWKEKERIRQKKEYEEWERTKITFDEFVAKQPPEKQEEIRQNMGLIKAVVGEEDLQKRRTRTWPKTIGEILKQ